MNTSLDLKETYNRIAADWDADHASDTWWIEATDTFLSLVPPGGTILDVGCGAGKKSLYMHKRGFSVHGIDLSEKMIELARKKVPSARFAVANIAEPLPVKDVVDGVLAQAVLLHIAKRDVQRVIGNIVAPLKPGGHLYIAVKERRPGQPAEEIKTENDYGYDYQRFFSYYTAEELAQLVQAAGLKVVYQNMHEPTKTRWLQIIAKK